MKIDFSKAEAMFLSQEGVGCEFQVRAESLPLMEELKYLGILFISDGKREREIDKTDQVSGSSIAGSIRA